MNALRYGLFAMLCIASHAQADEKFQVYRQGSILNFRLASERFVCDSPDALKQVMRDIRTLGEKEAYKNLMRPLTRNTEGKLIVRDEISRKLPVTARFMAKHCVQSPPQLIIFAALDIELVEGHEVITTMVVDAEMRTYMTYFFDIRVLSPMPGTEEQIRLTNVITELDKMHNQASTSEIPTMRTDGVWRPTSPQN